MATGIIHSDRSIISIAWLIFVLTVTVVTTRERHLQDGWPLGSQTKHIQEKCTNQTQWYFTLFHHFLLYKRRSWNGRKYWRQYTQ